MNEKKLLRKEIRDKIRRLPLSYKIREGERMGRLLISTPEFIEAQSIFVYMSSPDEPETRLIIKEAFDTGKRVYVPLCVSRGEMKLVRIFRDTVFVKGFMGIREPADISETAEDTDLAVIPCLSADKTGRRLGHGAGFYDRFLARSKAKKFCLCFPAVISADIPTESHDIRMDRIIT